MSSKLCGVLWPQLCDFIEIESYGPARTNFSGGRRQRSGPLRVVSGSQKSRLMTLSLGLQDRPCPTPSSAEKPSLSVQAYRRTKVSLWMQISILVLIMKMWGQKIHKELLANNEATKKLPILTTTKRWKIRKCSSGNRVNPIFAGLRCFHRLSEATICPISLLYMVRSLLLLVVWKTSGCRSGLQLQFWASIICRPTTAIQRFSERWLT